MGLEEHVHVVSKQDNTRHATCKLLSTQRRSELAPSSVRVCVELVSLSSNNLNYARGGTLLHWWDAYPVPEDAPPPPFNDAGEWSIVTGWGRLACAVSPVLREQEVSRGAGRTCVTARLRQG